MKTRAKGLIAAAALVLASFHLVGWIFFDGFALDLGSLNVPSPRYVSFVEVWTLFGGVSSVLLALALSSQVGTQSTIGRLLAAWTAPASREFLVGSCVSAIAIPLLLRLVLLESAPLADDESAYRFAAQLLASGRLSVASPPAKLFFDQNFMINDGQLYPAYFLGWPALLAVGVWIQAPAIVNPIVSALTVPPLARVLGRIAGPEWVRPGVVLFLLSPFTQVAASTWLAHTACLMALTWSLSMYLRTTERPSWYHDAGFGFFVALAFCIRPQATVPLGFPLVGLWFMGVLRLPLARRGQALWGFLVPVLFLATLFLGALWLQNGSPWLTGYSRYGQYLIENNFRFTSFLPSDLTPVVGFDFSNTPVAIIRTLSGVLRLNYDLFGWPSSLLLAALALPAAAKRSNALLWMVGSHFVLTLYQRDWGIDTFGPVHAFELTLPILVLTMLGAKELTQWQTRQPETNAASRWGVGPSIFACLIASLTVTACLGFVPYRLMAVRQIAAHINLALRAPERGGLQHAVIFAPLPFAPPCGGVPQHFVFFRPTNDPDLKNDVLWINHLNEVDDVGLLNILPGRTGYVLRWTEACQVSLSRLALPGASPTL